MSDHLPECPCANTSAHPDGCLCCEVSSPCICDRLRACEQRVADEIWGAIRDGSQYKSGFEGGLDAAREAVDAMVTQDCPDNLARWVWPYGPKEMQRDALAAIDALRRLDTTDCLCPTPNPDCQHPTCPRLENQ